MLHRVTGLRLNRSLAVPADAADAVDPELLLAAAAGAATAVRGGARGRIAVLEFFSRRLAPRLAAQAAAAYSAGSSNAAVGSAAHTGATAPGSRALRAWLRRVAPLAADRHPETRAAAAAALAAAEQCSAVAAPAPAAESGVQLKQQPTAPSAQVRSNKAVVSYPHLDIHLAGPRP